MSLTPDTSASETKFRKLIAPLARVTLLAACTGGAAFVAPGCSTRPREAATPPPLIIDEAMQRRDWPQTVAYRASGRTVAGPSRAPLTEVQGGPETPVSTAPPLIGAVVEPFLFLGNVVMLPFTYLAQGPGTTSTVPATSEPATFTAFPTFSPDATWIDQSSPSTDNAGSTGLDTSGTGQDSPTQDVLSPDSASPDSASPSNPAAAPSNDSGSALPPSVDQPTPVVPERESSPIDTPPQPTDETK